MLENLMKLLIDSWQDALERLFDREVSLQVILNCVAEDPLPPFMLQRVIDQESVIVKPKRTFRQVYDENIWVTTSGVWSLDPMRCLLDNTKIDHFLHSIDFPFMSDEKGVKWMD